jgi:hypothetical protein
MRFPGDKQRARNKALKRLNEKWFAWYPVQLERTGEWAWFEYVFRDWGVSDRRGWAGVTEGVNDVTQYHEKPYYYDISEIEERKKRERRQRTTTND